MVKLNLFNHVNSVTASRTFVKFKLAAVAVGPVCSEYNHRDSETVDH